MDLWLFKKNNGRVKFRSSVDSGCFCQYHKESKRHSFNILQLNSNILPPSFFFGDNDMKYKFISGEKELFLYSLL